MRYPPIKIAGHEVSIGELLALGGAVVLSVSVLLSTTMLPWSRLVSLDVVVKEEGATPIAVVAALLSWIVVADMALFHFKPDLKLPLPFKKTIVPVLFAGLVMALILFVWFDLRPRGDASFTRGPGVDVAVVGALMVLGGAGMQMHSDPDPLIL